MEGDRQAEVGGDGGKQEGTTPGSRGNVMVRVQ